MVTDAELSRACALLETDLLPNVVTLKMLNCYRDAISVRLLSQGEQWAMLSLLPVQASGFDRSSYPDVDVIAFIDGNDQAAKSALLDALPRRRVVVKTGDDSLQAKLLRRPQATRTCTFLSFTSPPQGLGEYAPGRDQVVESTAWEGAAWQLFQGNGYAGDELETYFSNGARWFGIERDGRIVSACFVFQNYRRVWEVAGVRTHPGYQRQGLAGQAVAAALRWLAAQRLIPRYQARTDNLGSVRLAAGCGLVQFLRFDHYLLDLR